MLLSLFYSEMFMLNPVHLLSNTRLHHFSLPSSSPGPIKAAALHRIPLLASADFEPLINAPDTFTPDGLWILGETPEVRRGGRGRGRGYPGGLVATLVGRERVEGRYSGGLVATLVGKERRRGGVTHSVRSNGVRTTYQKVSSTRRFLVFQ